MRARLGFQAWLCPYRVHIQGEIVHMTKKTEHAPTRLSISISSPVPSTTRHRIILSRTKLQILGTLVLSSRWRGSIQSRGYKSQLSHHQNFWHVIRESQLTHYHTVPGQAQAQHYAGLKISLHNDHLIVLQFKPSHQATQSVPSSPTICVTMQWHP